MIFDFENTKQKKEKEKQKEKSDDLKDKVRQHLKEKRALIVEQSQNEDHCVKLMEKEMDDFVDSLVDKDEFWKEVPAKLIEDLKKEHNPIYKDAYVIPISSFSQSPVQKSPKIFFRI